MQEEIVGKSAGWVGPVEEYERNTGSVGHRKITFVGASYKFVHKVLRDMLLVGGFNDVELWVHDLRPEPLQLVGDLLEKMARQKKTNITVHRTLEREPALTGADAVILAITTGGREADCRAAEVCQRYGIPVAIGDTMGPPALARNLRSVPVVVELARTMERLCPQAVMLNFTNPLSVITGSMARYSSIPAWGLCHSADELYRYFSKVFNCQKSEVRMEVGGVNHQAFVTRLWIKGEERTKEILAATGASSAKLEDNLLTTRVEEVDLQRAVCRILGAWPSCGHTHLAEFYPFFFTERRLDYLNLRGDLRRVEPGRQPLSWPVPHPIIREWAYGPEPVGDMHLLTSEHAHELLWAVFTGQPFTRVLSTLNTGPFIRDLPTTACIEALVTIAGRQVSGTPITLTPAVHSLVQRWTTIHELSIQAAMTCDRAAAQQALLLDPHVRDLYDIEPLLEDLLQALAEWLPPGWAKSK